MGRLVWLVLGGLFLEIMDLYSTVFWFGEIELVWFGLGG